jgi:hypothetical protein
MASEFYLGQLLFHVQLALATGQKSKVTPLNLLTSLLQTYCKHILLTSCWNSIVTIC